ncbi:hypothetical protein C1645_837205 [Glomus cerebriforme]|uniref:Uncharacterized protein n=1 Tax=Glomus cerebriforme TaxID=658196 RepID=A0A397S9A1_9GLOM|nr:hypothetical protein C1645_837205 [Glomus cerebriforme]
MSQKSYNSTRQLRSHTKNSSSTNLNTIKNTTSSQTIDEEIVASTYTPQNNTCSSNSNNIENMDIDPINNLETSSTYYNTLNSSLNTTNDTNINSSQPSNSANNHVTDNNITIQLINNTLENLSLLKNYSLNASIHSHNTNQNNKGKNKETDNPMDKGLTPITKKHDFNHVTASTNIDQ